MDLDAIHRSEKYHQIRFILHPSNNTSVYFHMLLLSSLPQPPSPSTLQMSVPAQKLGIYADSQSSQQPTSLPFGVSHHHYTFNPSASLIPCFIRISSQAHSTLFSHPLSFPYSSQENITFQAGIDGQSH